MFITVFLLAILGCGFGQELSQQCTTNNKIYREVEYRKQRWYMYGSTDECKTCVEYNPYNANNTLYVEIAYWDPMEVQKVPFQQIGQTSEYTHEDGKCNVVYMDSDFSIEYSTYVKPTPKKRLDVFVRNIFVCDDIKIRINDYLKNVCGVDPAATNQFKLCPIEQCKGPRKAGVAGRKRNHLKFTRHN